LGFDVKSDPWVSHTDDFEELLQKLNAANGIVVDKGEQASSTVGDADAAMEIDRPAFGFGFGFQDTTTKAEVSTSSEKKQQQRHDLETKSKASRSRIQ
jgi:hypothetical protein